MTSQLAIRVAMETLARHVQQTHDVDGTLEMLTRSALETVPGTDCVSISMKRDDGEIETIAPTDLLAVAVDEVQYELREGPCYETVTSRSLVTTTDLAHDSRWPNFGPRAAAMGIRSQLAVVLVDEEGRRASLNLYSKQLDGFVDVDMAEMFASHAALVMGLARTVQQFDTAVGSRTVIGQAVGIIMERYDMRQERAFAFLVRTSQTSNVRLRLVAQEVVDEIDNRHT